MDSPSFLAFRGLHATCDVPYRGPADTMRVHVVGPYGGWPVGLEDRQEQSCNKFQCRFQCPSYPQSAARNVMGKPDDPTGPSRRSAYISSRAMPCFPMKTCAHGGRPDSRQRQPGGRWAWGMGALCASLRKPAAAATWNLERCWRINMAWLPNRRPAHGQASCDGTLSSSDLRSILRQGGGGGGTPASLLLHCLLAEGTVQLMTVSLL